jgi:hypothetical protein
MKFTEAPMIEVTPGTAIAILALLAGSFGFTLGLLTAGWLLR